MYRMCRFFAFSASFIETLLYFHLVSRPHPALLSYLSQPILLCSTRFPACLSDSTRVSAYSFVLYPIPNLTISGSTRRSAYSLVSCPNLQLNFVPYRFFSGAKGCPKSASSRATRRVCCASSLTTRISYRAAMTTLSACGTSRRACASASFSATRIPSTASSLTRYVRAWRWRGASLLLLLGRGFLCSTDYLQYRRRSKNYAFR